MTVRGVAGHQHLLGTSIKIEANPGTPRARTLLDVPVWNFDDQGSRRIAPYRLKPSDTVRVTCHHDQSLRDQQPSFEKQRADRYVVWGEGSTDEMCLGILLTTDG
jgi:protein involved in polysaccharide export with SLBB domain